MENFVLILSLNQTMTWEKLNTTWEQKRAEHIYTQHYNTIEIHKQHINLNKK